MNLFLIEVILEPNTRLRVVDVVKCTGFKRVTLEALPYSKLLLEDVLKRFSSIPPQIEQSFPQFPQPPVFSSQPIYPLISTLQQQQQMYQSQQYYPHYQQNQNYNY